MEATMCHKDQTEVLVIDCDQRFTEYVAGATQQLLGSRFRFVKVGTGQEAVEHFWHTTGIAAVVFGDPRHEAVNEERLSFYSAVHFFCDHFFGGAIVCASGCSQVRARLHQHDNRVQAVLPEKVPDFLVKLANSTEP